MAKETHRARRRALGCLLAGALGSLGATHSMLALAADAAAAPQTTQANDKRVVVLTSYPEELTARFQKAFEQQNPGTRVEILWRHAEDALAYLRRGGMAEIDVYWTPAPRNFATLKKEGKLARLALDTQTLPTKVAGYSISDPDGYYTAFELAGYGIAYNPEAVKKLGLPPPKDWHDLANPAYRGQVQIPIPGRVGFAPVMAEAVLQSSGGWAQGWAKFAALAANADFGSGDRTPDTDDVAVGRKAARLSIDFFIPPARRNANPAAGELAFVYPPKTAFNPAHIAISATAPHPDMARAFVDFLLSAKSQEMLLEPDVRRLPVRKDIYAAHPELSAQPFAQSALAYDDELRRARQGLVAALFDIALVKPHAEVLPLWNALDLADKENRGDPAKRREIHRLLTTVPVDDAAQQDANLRSLFAFPDRVPGQPEPKPAAARLEVEARWQNAIKAQHEQARQLLQAL
ncbi:MAG: extracellular solute-binding protein [Azoarcus sp.]|jgi:ABC-type Fe3+ transport system substrate-binding protein|nr:extracellular solute-binding protein [Azoarcus sp.]